MEWNGPIMFKGETVGELCYGIIFTNMTKRYLPEFTKVVVLGEKLPPADSQELERTIMLGVDPHLIATYDENKFLYLELFEAPVIFIDETPEPKEN
jgi:hypothetical protein